MCILLFWWFRMCLVPFMYRTVCTKFRTENVVYFLSYLKLGSSYQLTFLLNGQQRLQNVTNYLTTRNSKNSILVGNPYYQMGEYGDSESCNRGGYSQLHLMQQLCNQTGGPPDFPLAVMVIFVVLLYMMVLCQ